MEICGNLNNLGSGPKWRGYVDGVLPDGTLHGWALCAHDIAAPLKLDLYVHGFHIASTYNSVVRKDIARAIGLEANINSGFSFKLNQFEKEGSLELLRKYGMALPQANLVNDIIICISGTHHALPKKNDPAIFIDLGPHLPLMVQASSSKLREEQILGGADYQVSQADEHILLMSTPLFSADWYADTHGEVAITKLEPAEHYLRIGKELERPASPWFDTKAYLAATPAAHDSTLSPVVHYQLHGHQTWWPGQGKFRTASPANSTQKDYALLIHLYHLDSVPDLQRLVASFPDDADIFISIPTGSDLHDREEIAALFPRARDILTVANRGQDVGAFLETVRQLNGKGYRFFCKAHSKKGNKYPETWRRIMFDALAATPERVATIIDLFRKNPRVLVAGPSQFWLNGQDFELSCSDRLGKVMTGLGFGAGAPSQDWSFFAGTCFWIDARLTEMIADAITGDQFVETKVERNGQTAHVVERLFCHFAAIVGGRFALVDGCDWTAEPVVIQNPVEGSVRMPPDEDAGRLLVRHLSELAGPHTMEGTASQPPEARKTEPFRNADPALHGTIDVLINCWMGGREPMHDGLASLQASLALKGLTSAFIVSAISPVEALQSLSCNNVMLDRASLFTPPNLQWAGTVPPEGRLPDNLSLYFLQTDCLFRGVTLPEDLEFATAIERINMVHAFWRAILLRHRVKQFLIWGETAPKSILFIHLCRELGIEYQIIERGNFPGTISIDPMGQFGTGVYPRLVSHMSDNVEESANVDARFNEIGIWYESQRDNAAYANFQKRGTRDLTIIKNARQYGRPIILVIGSNDNGAGVTRSEPESLRVNWFKTSDNAFSVIREIISTKFPNALLVLRPHPSQAPQECEFVIVARETSLDDLIDNADICITISTTANALCLLKGKPLLTLGLSELNGQAVGEAVTDETHLLAALRRHIWAGFVDPYPDGANRRYIVRLFSQFLIGLDDSVPTRHDINDLARLLAGRVQRMKTGFLQDYAGREDEISQALYEDVRDRGRAVFRVDPRSFVNRERPPISVVLPIYGDYEGTRLCFEQLVRHRDENGFRVITVWDRGPDLRLQDLCREFAEKAGFTHLENVENVGFSGTVNQGILYAGRDDVILLNSDTVSCGDWALRLQDAAYAHPKIAAVVPLTNNATIFSIPFPEGTILPEKNPVEWVDSIDASLRKIDPKVLEMPVAHGFCTYVRRSAFDCIGLYDEIGFGIGQGEDNDFSMRIRMAGYFVGAATGIFIGHAGSTSFGDEVMSWKLAGRAVMNARYPHYMSEVRHFANNDPISAHRDRVVIPVA